MSALSDYLENKWLDHLLKNTAYTQPATLYFALFTADPGESGVAGELTIGTGAYARAAITNNNVNFPQCSPTGTPTKVNGAIIQFPTATTNWGTITHWAIYDAATGGTNMLMHGALSATRYVASGDSPKIAAGALSITITNATSGGITDYAKRKILDHTLGGPTYTPSGAVYLAAGTSLSGESLSELDFVSNTYARPVATFGSASGGISTTTAAAEFSASFTGGPETISSFGIYDDSTAGNLLVCGPFSTSRTANNGDTVTVPISGFTCTLQ